MTDRSKLLAERETDAGMVICHCSEDDGVPDVGLSVGLGDGKVLWIGDLLNSDGANGGIVFHGPNGQRIVAPFADGTEVGMIINLFQHYIGPAIAKIADAEAAAMRERAAKKADSWAAREEEEGEGGGRVWSASLGIAAAIRSLPATEEVGRG